MTTRSVLPAAVAVLACTIAGCSSSATKGSGSTAKPTGTSSSPVVTGGGPPTTGTSSSTSTGGGTSDYKSLLLTPSDIPISGFKVASSQAAPGGQGAAEGLTSADGTRQIGDTFYLLPNATAVAAAIQGAITGAQQQIPNATTKDLSFGSNGKLLEGTTSSGEVAVVVFAEGNAFVTIEFNAAKGDAAPESFVLQVAQTQDNKLKANPPK